MKQGVDEGQFGAGNVTRQRFRIDDQQGLVFRYRVPIQYVDVDNDIDKVVGHFYLFTDHAVVVNRIKNGLVLIIVNSMIKTAALWVIFLFFTKRIVAQPLGALSKAARALDPRAPTPGHEGDVMAKLAQSGHEDELKVLAGSLTNMRDSVVSKMQVIERQNATLEKRVAERTANLTLANESLAREVQERRKAQSDLRVYREAILQSDEAIFVTTPDGVIVDANPACERETGLSRDELIGSDTSRPGLGDQESEANMAMHASIKLSGHWRGEMDHVSSDGVTLPLWIVASAIYDKNKDIVHLVFLYRDISELKAKEARASQAQKLESIGQMAAGIAHEINTPAQYVADNIAFLSGAFDDLTQVDKQYQQLLEAARTGTVPKETVAAVDSSRKAADSEFLAAEIPDALAQSGEGVKRISTIVAAMKSFSHMGPERKDTADLNAAILSTITVSRAEWKYVAELTTDLAPDLPAVPCYLSEFNQVLLNLIVNAAHAIADVVDSDNATGQIVVSTRQVGSEVEIRVQDSGGGIPEGVRDRVFDPFFTTKEVGKGTGQGLTMAHNTIVDLHGGDLRFETKTGEGTTFIITIPLEEETAEKERAEVTETLAS